MEIEKTIGVISEAEASDAEAYHQSLSRGGGGGGQDNSDSVDGDELAEPEPPVQRKEILKALEAVERDSAAIADSFSSLFSSLRQSLSQATGSTVEHMNCFSDATGRLQECVLDASTKGNRYINSCLRLNEEMKGMDALATQLLRYCGGKLTPFSFNKTPEVGDHNDRLASKRRQKKYNLKTDKSLPPESFCLICSSPLKKSDSEETSAEIHEAACSSCKFQILPKDTASLNHFLSLLPQSMTIKDSSDSHEFLREQIQDFLLSDSDDGT